MMASISLPGLSQQTLSSRNTVAALSGAPVGDDVKRASAAVATGALCLYPGFTIKDVTDPGKG
jgi:hypothetical protein